MKSSSLIYRAEEVTGAGDSIVVSENERRAFLDILAGDPPAPTKKALEAAKKYRRGTKKVVVQDSAK